ETFERFSRANNAVEFTLLDTDSKEHKLSDFKGKPVYLNFWSTSSIPSLRELKVMKVLHQKYGKKIHFISINLDNDSTINQSIKAKNTYDWTFLHFGDDYDLREKYQVATIPTYFLINENGGIIKAFAEGPVDVERRLYNLVK
ncbi:MAG: TlpA family protein disulfide reductase, partial [Flavobacteriales bacterium]|nr:TlpA family protein disulfide reductase [Flavobacteriales bacterium]